MLVDPFTVIAQIVNFAILVVALRYLLYDRVVTAMDQREERIAERLESVEERAEELDAEQEELRRDREELEDRRDDMMDEARRDAHERRRELLQEARHDVDEQRRAWQRSLTAEQRDTRRRLQRRTADQLTLISRDALADLADADLEERVIEMMLAELERDDEARRRLLGDGSDTTSLEVVTAFPADDHHQRIEERLRSFGLDDDATVDFAVDSDLVMGAEIRADGRVVAWNVADYVGRLDAALDELLDELDVDDRDDGDAEGDASADAEEDEHADDEDADDEDDAEDDEDADGEDDAEDDEDEDANGEER